jgi:hypothetical protein
MDALVKVIDASVIHVWPWVSVATTRIRAGGRNAVVGIQVHSVAVAGNPVQPSMGKYM